MEVEMKESIVKAFTKRTREAVLVIVNSKKEVLMSTKLFYPKNTFRMPSGGINDDETPEQGAQRELYEETGITEKAERIFDIEYSEEGRVFFTTYAFLVKSDRKPVCHDEHEQLGEFKYVTLERLGDETRHLKSLIGKAKKGTWEDWGKFRAIAHEKTLEYLRKEGL